MAYRQRGRTALRWGGRTTSLFLLCGAFMVLMCFITLNNSFPFHERAIESQHRLRVQLQSQAREAADIQEINSINQFIQNAGEHKDKQQQQKQQQQDQPEGASSSLSVAKEVKLEADEKHRDRQEYLRSQPSTYFDIEIAGVPKGRIVFALYNDTSPLAAENFRQLCTGEKENEMTHMEKGAYWLKDKYFYRIVHDFVDQTGTRSYNQDFSIYGKGYFKDDPEGLKLKFDKPGLIAMANWGPDTNSAHFFITMGKPHNLDGLYVIFGEVVRGFDIVKEINNLAKDKLDKNANEQDGAKIVYAGQCKTYECNE